MILRRMGNKSKIAKKIEPFFPEHKIYIEPFFGAGGMFFNKRKSKHEFVNDFDNDVFNLFKVVKEKHSDLKKAIMQMPIHETLYQYWIENKEECEIMKAVRFLFLSNFSYLGQTGQMTCRVTENIKQIIIKNIEPTFERMQDVMFVNCDFRKVLKHNIFKTQDEKNEAFIYCDPPYLGTADNYSSSFTEKDSFDLFEILCESKIKFAMSEFNHPFIIEQAENRKLNLITIGERQNLKNRRTEILITNYEQQPTLFS